MHAWTPVGFTSRGSGFRVGAIHRLRLRLWHKLRLRRRLRLRCMLRLRRGLKLGHRFRCMLRLMLRLRLGLGLGLKRRLGVIRSYTRFSGTFG